MTLSMTKVIIWGVDDYNTLGLFRALGKYNLDITFLVFQGIRHCATLSKYCKKYVETPTLEDGMKFLCDNYHDTRNKAIIIDSNDLIAEFLDRNSNKLSNYFIIPGTSSPGLIAKLNDKAEMTRIADEIGFDVPPSMVCKWNSNIDDVEYPCLLKPTHQTLGKYNEFKFKICKNRRTLKRVLRFVRKESSFILQRYIPKESVALVYGCRTLDGRTYLAGVLEKDRFCDNGDGSHGILMPDFPSYINKEFIESFMNRVDFHGLFSVEFLVYQGKAYFIEINWRNDGTSHLFFQAGANMPLLWIMSSIGNNVTNVPKEIRQKHFFIDEVFDEENMKRGIITKDKWIKEKEEASVFKYFDEEDPAPYAAVLKEKRKKLLLDHIVAKNRLYIVYLLDKLGIKRH